MPLARLAASILSLALMLGITLQTWAAPDAPGAAGTPTTKVLKKAEVERYISTLDDMIAAGIDAQKEMGVDPSEAKAMKQSAAYSSRMLGIIERHGFDPETFTSVHWNVMMAYAAAEMAKHQPEIDAARREQAEQMAKLKAQLPPEQYEAMARGMAGMNAFAETTRDVPEENLRLVESHRAQLEKVFDKGR